MAHLIDMSNSRANMAYVGATPWHGLGSKLAAGATIETWLVEAGMQYKVLRAPVQYMNGSMHTFAGKDVLYRSDTNGALGVVSDGYKIVQPVEVLEFFRDLCNTQGFALETAGVLKDGALYWALAKTGHVIDIAGTDRTEGYVLLSTSADGTRSTDARFTSIRVVCNNTMSIAMSAGNKSATKTSHRSIFDANATKRALGLAEFDATWNAFRENLMSLQSKPVSRSAATDFFSQLLRPTTKPVSDFQGFMAKLVTPDTRAIRGLAELEASYTNAPGAAPGSAYGLVQAVTHYIDHSRGASQDKRLTSAWFGQGDAIKSKAFELALAI